MFPRGAPVRWGQGGCSGFPDGSAIKELSVRGNHGSAFPSIPHLLLYGVWGGQDEPPSLPQPQGKPCLKHSSTCSSGVKQLKRRIFHAGRVVDIPSTLAPLCPLPPSSINRKKSQTGTETPVGTGGLLRSAPGSARGWFASN